MANNTTPLIPTSIVDKNGKQTTVHKKLLTGSAGTSNLPAPGSSGQKKNIDWSSVSSDDAITMLKNNTQTLSDPTHLWDNFEFYTGMMRSRHRVEARAAFDKNNVLASLRGAWLDMHGMKLDVDRDKYYKLKGPDGYDAFIKARDNLLDAHKNPGPSKFKPSKNPSAEKGEDGLFASLRGRKERKELEYRQKREVRYALDLAAPLGYNNESDSIANSLSRAELEKANEVLEILWEQKDEDAIKNFGRALHLDDDDKNGMVHVLHAHKDYIKENTGYVGILFEIGRYLKNKGWDNQQEDGSIPHLEEYADEMGNDMLKIMRSSGEGALNVHARPHIERAIRRGNQRIVDNL